MTRFKEYNPEQLLLLPPDLSEWLADGRLAIPFAMSSANWTFVRSAPTTTPVVMVNAE